MARGLWKESPRPWYEGGGVQWVKVWGAGSSTLRASVVQSSEGAEGVYEMTSRVTGESHGQLTASGVAKNPKAARFLCDKIADAIRAKVE